MDNREKAALMERIIYAINREGYAGIARPEIDRFLHWPDGEARAAIEGETRGLQARLEQLLERLRDCKKEPPMGWQAHIVERLGSVLQNHGRVERVLEAAPCDVAQTGLSQQDYDNLVRDAMKWRMHVLHGAGGDKGAGTTGEPKLVHTAGQYPASVPAAAPLPTALQRTAGDVLRQFRESGSEDWGELESAINWWAMNDFCPNFTKGDRAVSEGRLREALEHVMAVPITQKYEGELVAEVPAVDMLALREAAALESA